MPIQVKAGEALVAACQADQGNLGLQGYVEKRAHAGTHHFRVVGVNAAGAQQASETTKPGEGPQYRAQVARILSLVQVNGFFAGFRPRRAVRHGHHGQNPWWRSGVGELRHLAVIDEMGLERALPVLVGTGDIQLRGPQAGLACGCFLQLEHQMLTLDEVVAKRLPVLFLVQFFDVGQIHAGAPSRFWRSSSMA